MKNGRSPSSRAPFLSDTVVSRLPVAGSGNNQGIRIFPDAVRFIRIAPVVNDVNAEVGATNTTGASHIGRNVGARGAVINVAHREKRVAARIRAERAVSVDIIDAHRFGILISARQRSRGADTSRRVVARRIDNVFAVAGGIAPAISALNDIRIIGIWISTG
jgi:hypothetical protein